MRTPGSPAYREESALPRHPGPCAAVFPALAPWPCCPVDPVLWSPPLTCHPGLCPWAPRSCSHTWLQVSGRPLSASGGLCRCGLLSQSHAHTLRRAEGEAAARTAVSDHHRVVPQWGGGRTAVSFQAGSQEARRLRGPESSPQSLPHICTQKVSSGQMSQPVLSILSIFPEEGGAGGF